MNSTNSTNNSNNLTTIDLYASPVDVVTRLIERRMFIAAREYTTLILTSVGKDEETNIDIHHITECQLEDMLLQFQQSFLWKNEIERIKVSDDHVCVFLNSFFFFYNSFIFVFDFFVFFFSLLFFLLFLLAFLFPPRSLSLFFFPSSRSGTNRMTF